MAKRFTGNTTEEAIVARVNRRVRHTSIKPARAALKRVARPAMVKKVNGTKVSIRRF